MKKRVISLAMSAVMIFFAACPAFAAKKEEQTDVGTTVYYKNNFEDGKLKSFTLTSKTNRVEIEEDKSGNHYVAFEAVDGSSDFYADYSISNVNRYLVVQFDIATTKKVAALGLQYRDADRKVGYIAQLNTDAEFKASYSSVLCTLDTKKSKWTNVALAMDFQNRTMDVYINNKETAKAVNFGSEGMQSITSMRFYCAGGNQNEQGAKTMIDNMLVYEGTKPRKISFDAPEDEVCKITTNNTEAINALGKDTVALSIGSNSIYYGGEKHTTDAAAYVKDNRTLIPVRAVAEAFGLDVSWDGDTSSVTIDGKTKIKLDDTNMILPDGSTYTLDVPAQVVNNRTFLPLRALCENVLGKNVFWDDHGLIVISDKEYSADEKQVVAANNYLLYDRPDSAKIKELFESVNQNSHPRILMNKDQKEKLIYNYNNNETVRSWGDSIIAVADKALMTNMPQYILSNNQLLPVSRTVYNRVQYFSMAYILTGDKKYTDCMYKNFEAAGSFPDWHPEHFLDVGEMTTAFAIGYDWCYDAWTDEQKKYLEDKIYEYGVKVGHNCYYGTESAWWLPNNDSNWNVVCNGGIAIGSMAIFDKYPEMCADNISLAVRNVEVMMNSFYPDGAWFEGVGYWSYTMDYLMNFVSSLNACFDTEFNITAAPGLSNTANYVIAGDGPVAMNNFHDSSENHQSNPSLFWLSDRFNQPGLTNIRLYTMQQYKYTPTIFDMLWYNTNIKGTDFNFQKDFYLRDVEFVSMRSSWTDNDATYLSYHAGSNNVNHGHIDAGTFVVDMLGERWAADLGSDDYALNGYFGDNRYKYYRLRPEGHNLYVINPDDKNAQELNSFSAVEKLESKTKGAYSIVDLTPAYEKQAKKARRGYMLADDRRSVIIRDEITFKEDKNDFYWFMHTKAEAEIVDNKTAILTIKGKKVKVMLDTDISDYEFYVTDASPLKTSPQFEQQNKNTDYRKLALHSKNASGLKYVQIKIISMTDPCIDVPFENTALDNWSIADGEILEIPTADMLYRDGEEVENFNPTTTGYEFTVPFNVKTPPQFSVDVAEGVDAQVVQAKTFDTPAKITVSLKENPLYKRIYTINIKQLPHLENVGEYNRYQIYNCTASSAPEAAHQPANAFDNSTEAESRWTSSGKEEWLQADLGEEKAVSAIGLSFWKASSRTYKFSIRISKDGKTWQEVLTSKESMPTEDISIYNLDQTYNARYVRFVGFSNSVNDYNNVTEFAILNK